jgi:ubiquitin C-terminal hydrolase
MLGNLNRAAFAYKDGVPNVYAKEVFLYKLFWAKLEKTTICGRKECGKSANRIDEFYDLSLTMITKVSEKASFKEPVDFTECMDEYFKTETLEKDNMMDCEHCDKKN